MKNTPRRTGMAIVIVLAAMAILTVILSVITLQIVEQRRVVRQRHRQLQADWLTRAGLKR